MKKMLESLREASRQAIEEAVDMDSLEALRVRYLGKKGELTAILKQMGKLSAEERPVIGQLANEVRSELENEIESRKSALAARLQEAKLRAETLDVTMPGKEISLGKKHVMNTVLDEVVDIFIGKVDAAHIPHIAVYDHHFAVISIVQIGIERRNKAVETDRADAERHEIAVIVLRQRRDRPDIIVNDADIQTFLCLSRQNIEDRVPHPAFFNDEVFEKDEPLRLFQLLTHRSKHILAGAEVMRLRVRPGRHVCADGARRNRHPDRAVLHHDVALPAAARQVRRRGEARPFELVSGEQEASGGAAAGRENEITVRPSGNGRTGAV